MKEPEHNKTEVKVDFGYDIDWKNNELIIWKDGKKIIFSYWESLTLSHIITKNIN